MSGSNFWLSGAWTLREGCGKCFLSPRLFFSVSTSCLGYMMLHFSLKQRNTWCQSWCSAAVLVELQSISVCCCGSLVLSFHLWLREHKSHIGSKLQQRKSVLRKKKKISLGRSSGGRGKLEKMHRSSRKQTSEEVFPDAVPWCFPASLCAGSPRQGGAGRSRSDVAAKGKGWGRFF